AGLVASINTGTYDPAVSGNKLVLRQGVGTSTTLTVSGTVPTAGSGRVTVSTTSAANHLFVHLTGIEVVNGATYTLKINGTTRSVFTATAGTLANIATGLAGALTGGYVATATTVTANSVDSWAEVLGRLK